MMSFHQAGWICKDYIINRLTVKDLMSLKIGLVSSHWSMSDHVILAGQVLENMYPRTYSNLCRKLCVTMSSAKVVRTYLNSFLEVLFEGDGITWAKVSRSILEIKMNKYCSGLRLISRSLVSGKKCMQFHN